MSYDTYLSKAVEDHYNYKDGVERGDTPIDAHRRDFDVNGKWYAIINLVYIDGRTETELEFPIDRQER